jgi:hypothetical protein
VAVAGLLLAAVDRGFIVFRDDTAHSAGIVLHAHVRVELWDAVLTVWVLCALLFISLVEREDRGGL